MTNFNNRYNKLIEERSKNGRVIIEDSCNTMPTNKNQQPPRSEWGVVRSDLLRIKTKDHPSDLPSTCVREIRRKRA